MLILCARSTAAPPADGATDVLVTVNGDPITQADLDFAFLLRQIPDERRAGLRKRVLEELIDRRLIQGILAHNKIQADEEDVDGKIAWIKQRISRSGKQPDEVLKRIGVTPQRLRAEIALPLRWRKFVRLAVTDTRLREHFQAHRAEFDGTEVRAAQIFLKLPADAPPDQVKEAENRLQSIRAEIAGGKISFAEAARRYSQAPSAKDGGDLGFFPWRGKMPVEFSRAAFPLKSGEVSQPFRTPFGLHLVTVTDRRPGQLSLEDCRLAVLKELGDALWKETVEKERKTAQIEWRKNG